jgi:hypothetical protein
LYQEKQKFNQWWLQGLFYAGVGLCIYASVQQLLYKIPFGNNPAPDGLLIAFILLYLMIFLLFNVMTLITEIDHAEIRYRFFPFQKNFRILHKKDVLKLEIITYKPIVDYGGWGIRFGRKGRAYNVAGNEGLHITKKDHKTFLLGTQNPDELEEFLIQHGWIESGPEI